MNMMNELSKWTDVIRKRRNMNQTIKELHRLTDSELSDIGINRGDIDNVARSIIDFHRNVRDS
jgi:uncharacterized protein YjiS (DUF1127 family)